jgi:hypothetical protein
MPYVARLQRFIMEHCIDWRNVMGREDFNNNSAAGHIATIVDELVSGQISDLSREEIDQVVGGFFEAEELAG